MTTHIAGSHSDIEQMKFGNLDGLPILYSAIRSYCLTTTSGGRVWTVIEHNVACEGTALSEREFFVRFGSDLPPLPEWMRKFDHRLWSVERDGLVFRRFLRGTPWSQDPAENLPATDRVHILFPERNNKWPSDKKPKARGKLRKPRRKNEFYLGRHEYSAGGPCGWVTEYRLRRKDKAGTQWEIFCTDENCAEADNDDPPFESMGCYSTEEAMEYFNSVHFEVSDEKWRQMGCRKIYRQEEHDCDICRMPFEGNPFTVHKCKGNEFVEDA